MIYKDKNFKELRVIKTARDEKSINEAIKNGLKPIIKKVEPSDKIRTKYSVIKNKKNGEIRTIGDYRGDILIDNLDEYETIIDWTFYYPYHFKLPFAAYLIPEDLKIGEVVFIEDLIEDFIGSAWNQGDTYRLESAEAIWDGTDLEILYDPKINCNYYIG
jgi:hypothetical protein